MYKCCSGSTFFVYLWLLWYISVVCISGGSGQNIFQKRLEIIIIKIIND